MKRTKRKMLNLLLALMMVLVLMPTTVFATDAEEAVCQNMRTNQKYTSIATARDEAEDGDTLMLLKSVPSFSLKNGKTLTLDLGGFSVEGNITMYGPGFLTVKNGTVKNDVWVRASATDQVYNSFTLAKGAKIESTYGIIVQEHAGGAANYGTTINIDGEITGTNSGLWVLGNIHTDLETAENPVVVNVGSTARMTNVNTDKIGSALQMAGSCVVTVEDGAEIKGPTGIEVRAGKLIVNGGKITATASSAASNPNDNGASTLGAGIGVAQHVTKLPISVTVNDGDITGYTALYVTNPEGNEVVDDKVSATVNGGKLVATNDEKTPIVQDNSAVNTPITVTGGTFSGDVIDYVAAEATYVEGSGTYAVGKEAKTLVDNAKEGDSLTIYQYEGEVTVPEGVNINNETGEDLTVNGSPVTDGETITSDHESEAILAKNPTCTADGNIAYWHCTVCDKYYSDEACTTEITLADTVLPKKHGETEIKNAVTATCTAEGYTGDEVCKQCGETIKAGETIAKIAHTYKDGKCTVCGAEVANVPPTGDTSNVTLYIVLMLVAGAGLLGAAVYRRKASIR